MTQWEPEDLVHSYKSSCLHMAYIFKIKTLVSDINVDNSDKLCNLLLLTGS